MRVRLCVSGLSIAQGDCGSQKPGFLMSNAELAAAIDQAEALLRRASPSHHPIFTEHLADLLKIQRVRAALAMAADAESDAVTAGSAA